MEAVSYIFNSVKELQFTVKRGASGVHKEMHVCEMISSCAETD